MLLSAISEGVQFLSEGGVGNEGGKYRLDLLRKFVINSEAETIQGRFIKGMFRDETKYQRPVHEI